MPRGRYRGGHCLTSSPRASAPLALFFARAPCCSGERLPLAHSGERISADPPPLLRRAGATGPRVSTERPPPPPSPPSRAAGAPPPDPASVVTRAPGEETEPSRSPASASSSARTSTAGWPAGFNFFRRFLDFFGLQPHHLPANACVLLSCYVAFMEATPACGRTSTSGAGSST
ncbi:hypothetical protein QYE76_051376 [Lolium multiflorum]|uniref:Uncharacterized protein n=1 Tax=Lolium multiflorum TaxID=4521 RepID=A0AAD8WHU9_LOLMU|nr:hypothetical protein QYE76_051376 [Lolium multiflorum]